MNDSRVFESKKSWLLALLQLGMPSEVIQKMLDIAKPTIYNYYLKLQENKEWDQKMIAIDVAKPKILKIYAGIECGFGLVWEDIPSTKNWDHKEKTLFKEKLMTVLAMVLEKEKILETIRLALPAITSFSEIRYTDDVPIGYRRLIDALWPKYGETISLDVLSLEKIVWRRYLTKIWSAEDMDLPKLREFFWHGDHFVSQVIRLQAQRVREYIAPILTIRICPIIDEAVKNLPINEQKVIEKYYGIYEEPKTLEMIGNEFTLTKERVRQIKEKTIKKIRRTVANDLKSVSNAWEDRQILKENHEKEIMEIQEYNKQNLQEIVDVPADDNANLFLRIIDLDFSVRATNCIIACLEVTYLWELVQYTHQELLKVRNFGKKSLPEVVYILKQKNLTLGMKFTKEQIIYLKSRSK